MLVAGGQTSVKRESRRHLNRVISGRELWSRENRGAHCIITQLLIFYCSRAAELISPLSRLYLLCLTFNTMSAIIALALDKIIMSFIINTFTPELFLAS